MEILETRRNRVFDLMQENSALILFAGAAKIHSEDEFLPYDANRNFFYLTNIEQENSVLLMIKGIGERKIYLFVDEYNETKEKWTGRRLTNDEASYISGIENIYSTGSYENMLSLALARDNNQYGQISHLYIDLSPELKIKDEFYTKDLAKFVENEYPHIEVINLHPSLTKLRMIKQSDEIANLIKAINLTNEGIHEMILNLKEGLYEHDLADIFEMYGRKNGRHPLAFSTIVASGKNATCLHYPSQNDIVKEDDLILFDLGYKNEGYCADISRTFPVNGVFKGTQKKVYEAVLNTNKAVITYVRAGMTIADLQEYAKQCLKAECVRLGLMHKDEDIFKYYFHNVSHHLGIDTHDVSDRNLPLENGNVITVEPGLYFANLGIGVRIEDDVLIKDGKGECLSKGIVKEISDVEELMRNLRKGK